MSVAIKPVTHIGHIQHQIQPHSKLSRGKHRGRGIEVQQWRSTFVDPHSVSSKSWIKFGNHVLLAPEAWDRIRETNAANPVLPPPSMSRSTPSRTASANGRVELEPPRKRFQMVSAKVWAWASEENIAAPVAPPKLRVTIFPLAWHALISAARNWQLASSVPGKTPVSALQIFHSMS